MTQIPIIFGVQGLQLTDAESSFFRDVKPAGYILFKRNCDTSAQVKQLCAALTALHGHKIPILIDQEGGRVQRLRQPHFVETLALKHYTTHPDTLDDDQAKLANQLHTLGINVNCTPCLDLVADDCPTTAIGDRSFGSNPQTAITLGTKICATHLAHGITPVIKHMPGHGRADVDSHTALPIVTAPLADVIAHDCAPFKQVYRNVPQAWGMTTHIVFPEIDPELPITLSPNGIEKLIRQACGFDGLLLSDDVYMDALKPFGDIPTRVKRCISAGVDLALHCHGTVADMEQAVKICPPMHTTTIGLLNTWQRT